MNKRVVGFVIVLCLTFLSGLSFGQDLLIKNGTILTVTKGTIPKGDILILGGIIKEIAESIEPP